MYKIFKSTKVIYNALSLLNVFLGFVFLLTLGQKIGANSDTDIYFYSLVIINYLGFIVQSFWEAIKPYYVELKVTQKFESDKLYSFIFSIISLSSIIVVCGYYAWSRLTNNVDQSLTMFLDVFIFYFIIQNLIIYNKVILNLEGKYGSFYLVDTLLYTINITALFFITESGINIIAYSTIIGAMIGLLYQQYLIINKLKIKMSLCLSYQGYKKILDNSVKLKLGSFMTGLKEPLLANVFNSLGPGYFSLYSYANKFAVATYQIVNAPILNIYVTAINHIVAKNKFNVIRREIIEVLKVTIVLFSISSVFILLLFPDIVTVLFQDKFTNENVSLMHEVYILMILYYFIIVIESPFSRLNSALKNFSYSLFVNFIFFVWLIMGFFIYKYLALDYSYFLIFLSIAQTSNLILHYFKSKKFFRITHEI